MENNPSRRLGIERWFTLILVACFTYQVIFVPPLPDFSQATLLKTLEVFQDPPILLALFLGVAQTIHAGIGGFIGSVLARVLLHRAPPLGVLTFDFPGYGGQKLQQVSWDEWLKTFKERKLVFLFQEHMKSGKQSNFFHLDSPFREHD